MTTFAHATPRRMTVRTIAPFLAITFALTWGIAALLVFLPDTMEAVFGPMGYTNPAFILAVYGPSIAGTLLVGRYYGLRGLGSFFRRVTLWRMSAPWWAFLVVGIPALSYLSSALSGHLGDPFPFSPWHLVFPALASRLITGPVEEIGWRGVALPLLQRRLAPLWAGLVIGVIWGIWHLPAFAIGGTAHAAWDFGPYFLGVVALSVIVTATFNASRGSLLIAALFHFQVMNPIFPEAQPWMNLVVALAAVAIVIRNPRMMLRGDGAVTEVLMPGTEHGRRG
ncbi:type II CAAX endopeptidase family protein [soil metagenome]